MRWAASDVSPSSHLAFHIPNTCRFLFVLCCVLGLGGLLLCCVFGFLFCKCFGIPNSPRSLDLDDRQGLIASSAMQQKKKITWLANSTKCCSQRSLSLAWTIRLLRLELSSKASSVSYRCRAWCTSLIWCWPK